MPTEFGPHDLTSATSHSPFVVSSSSNYTTLENFHAFDGASSTGHYWLGTGGGVDWLQLDCGSGITHLLGSYALQMDYVPEAARAPKNWTMLGSNDGSTWNTLDTRTNEINWNTANEVRTYTCATVTTAYRYFRLNITANNGDATYTQVAELFLYLGTAAAPTQRGNIAYNQIRSAARQGTGNKIQMFGGGSIVAGHLAAYDTNGNVVDGGAIPAAYVLPPATVSSLGGVKVGANITVAGDGTISVAAPGSGYTLPIASASVLGGVKIGTNVAVAGDGTISVGPNLSLGGTLAVTGSATFSSTITATGTVNANGSLVVNATGTGTGYGQFINNGNIAGTGRNNPALYASGGTLDVIASLYVNSALTVTGLATLNGGITTTGITCTLTGARSILASGYGVQYPNLTNGNNAFGFGWNGSLQAYVNNSNVGNITLTSERWMKEDVQPYERGLDAIRQLRPVSFRYIPQPWRGEGQRRYGLIADEVEPIIPEMIERNVTEVEGEEKELRYLDPRPLWYMLLNAAQELDKRLVELEAWRTTTTSN
jgi:F5/8 type C domain/Chaperone of endosialidase